MTDKSEYRALFYQNYYQSQVGRFQGIASDEKITIEKDLFKTEIVPLISVSKDAAILDIGSGFGSFLLALKESGFTQCKGVDISEEQVSTAKKLGIHNIEQGDVFDYLNAHPQSFDLITALDVAEHFNKAEIISLLMLMKKALKPKGSILMRFPNADAPMGNVYLYGDFTHELVLNASSAQQLLMNVGFHQISIIESRVKVKGFFKSILQQLSWMLLKGFYKWMLFATARTSKGVILSPNIIVLAKL